MGTQSILIISTNISSSTTSVISSSNFVRRRHRLASHQLPQFQQRTLGNRHHALRVVNLVVVDGG